jgi:hypothetical protein
MKDNSPYVIALNSMIRNYKDYVFDDKEIDYDGNKISPKSGYEPKFEPKKWNDGNVQYNHNCYAYVLNTISPKRDGKPQPGYFSNFPPLKDNEYNCLTFYERLRKDIPSMYLTTFDEKCKKGFYKGFLAIDDKPENSDFHFYRMNNNGYWSHKPGRLEAVDYDASAKKIKNPAIANRKYDYFNYSKPCFFFCLNNKMSRSRSSSKYKYFN